MKNMRIDRIAIIVISIVLVVIMLFAFVSTASLSMEKTGRVSLTSLTARGNRAIFDMTYKFDRAVIMLPNEPGGYVCGNVESWQDYENSDVVQVKVDGKVYLTHYSNVVLIDD